MKVIEGGQKEELLFVCNCGCTSFMITEYGIPRCANCNFVHEPALEEYHWRFPKKKATDKIVDPNTAEKPTVDVIEMSMCGASFKRFIENLSHKELTAMVAIYNTGRVNTWGNSMVGKAQAKWLKRRLRAAWELLAAG